MNFSRDPVIRKRVMTMACEIYDRGVAEPHQADELGLTAAEKKAIDRLVVKYLETAKYVKEVFATALAAVYGVQRQ